MATDDQQVLITGTAPTPATWRVPGNGQIRPKAIRATFDGTNAVVPFRPAVKITSDGGQLVGVYPLPTSVAAGASADVSWFPGIAGQVVSGAQVGFFGAIIVRTTNQSVPNSTATDAVFDTVSVDTASMANLGANAKILTSALSGFYEVSFQVSYSAHADTLDRRIYIFKNGFRSLNSGIAPAIQIIPAISGATIAMNTSCVTFLAAGDFVSAGFLQTSGAALNALADTGTGAGFASYQLAAAIIGVS